ncbi:MAG: hypothetical protein AAF447_21835 [Myxococcota bacterium]
MCIRIAALAASLLLVACGDDDGTTGGAMPDAATTVDMEAPDLATEDLGPEDAGGTPMTFVLENDGTTSMEGHTPRGFMGQGIGLFAGDNLNPRFPDGDGVQFFVSFDLSTLPAGTIESATLRSENASVAGSPYADLGNLSLEEIRYASFGAALWNAPVVDGGFSCVFATSTDGPFNCDVTSLVSSSRADDYAFAQMRFRLEQAGDSDGAQDLAQFFITDANTNEPGIFELEVVVRTP